MFRTHSPVSFIRDSQLVWNEGLPEGEIWVKLGGDKGGSCMKVTSVQSELPQNTSAFEAPDSISNLHITLEQYRQQGVRLQSLASSCC